MSRIKLHRQIEENPIRFSEPFTRWQARVDLLLLANHSDGFFYVRWNKIDVPRGCVGRAERTFQTRWKRSRDKVRKFLKDLEKSKNIIQQKNRLCSIYIIVNWDIYQTTDQTTEKPQKNHRKTNTRRIEEKEEKKTTFSPPTLQEVKEYFTSHWYLEDSADRAFEFYNVAWWIDSKWNKVRNWKQKMNSVWFKEENKVKELTMDQWLVLYEKMGHVPFRIKYWSEKATEVKLYSI